MKSFIQKERKASLWLSNFGKVSFVREEGNKYKVWLGENPFVFSKRGEPSCYFVERNIKFFSNLAYLCLENTFSSFTERFSKEDFLSLVAKEVIFNPTRWIEVFPDEGCLFLSKDGIVVLQFKKTSVGIVVKPLRLLLTEPNRILDRPPEFKHWLLVDPSGAPPGYA